MPPNDALLGGLGLSPAEEAVYHALLRHPRSSAGDLLEVVSHRRSEVLRLLAELVDKGLAARVAGRPTRYVPSAPQSAIEFLVLRRQQELEKARQAAAALQSQYESTFERAHPHDVVEVLTGATAVAQKWVQVAQSAQQEVLLLDKPPYSLDPGSPVGRELLRRFTGRTIFSAEELTDPETLQRVLGAGGPLDESRVLAHVPLKLAIVDRKVAIVAALHEGDIQGAFVVHESVLLDALITLFESLWARSSLLVPATDRAASVKPGRATDRKRLLTLLASGFKDERVARALGVSRATLERRIAELMRELGAQTRFQAGVLAREGGLVDPTRASRAPGT